MGQTGEFNEYQNTGSYNNVYNISNLPPQNSLFINDTAKHTGTWQTLQIVSASNFTELSGSIGGTVTGVIIPTGTQLKGHFVDIKLASGIVLALNEAVL